jgi:peptide-methionine (S)-S-oxide reductase
MSTDPMQTLVLAGGCFWCTEAVFVRVKGVNQVESGYANGHTPNPSYEAVCTGRTGYAEAIRLNYAPQVISLEVLLDIFFATHDPTSLNRQGADVGTQYRSGIYTSTPAQYAAVKDYVKQLEDQKIFQPAIVTELEPLHNFYVAEIEHQQFYERHPYHGYCMAVAAPKVDKLKHRFVTWVKDAADH